MHESLLNELKSGHERTKVWWTRKSLYITAPKFCERTEVGALALSVWDGLDIFASVWHLNLGPLFWSAENLTI